LKYLINFKVKSKKILNRNYNRMKKTILFIALLVLNSTIAQKKEKVKGNREIVTEKHDLETFKTIEVSDDFVIILTCNNYKSSYEVQADANIQDKINFNIDDEVLKITTPYFLLPSKKMVLRVNAADLVGIKLHGKSKIIQEGFATFSEDFSIETYDSSSLKMDFKSKNASVATNQKSTCELIIQTDSLHIDMDERTEIVAKLNTNWTNLRMYKNATATFEGSTTDLTASMVGKTKLKASKFMTNFAKINQSLSADSYLNVAKKITLYLTDDTKLYLYNSPEVVVEGIRDFAQIIKKKL
jgi:hypothetical protein